MALVDALMKSSKDYLAALTLTHAAIHHSAHLSQHNHQNYYSDLWLSIGNATYSPCADSVLWPYGQAHHFRLIERGARLTGRIGHPEPTTSGYDTLEGLNGLLQS